MQKQKQKLWFDFLINEIEALARNLDNQMKILV